MTRAKPHSTPRTIGTTLALALLLPLAAGCAETGQIVRSADVFNVLDREDPPLPGERRSLDRRADPLEVDPETAGTVSLPGPQDNAEWSQPGGTATNAPGHVAYAAGGGSAWRIAAARVDRRGRLTAPPIVHQGQVIVMDGEGSLSAYSQSGGGRSWSTSLRPEGQRDTAFGGGVAADGGVIVAATPFRQVHGIDPESGGVVWSSDIEAPARSAPTVAGGRAFVVSSDNKVYAFDASDGSELWRFTGSRGEAGVVGNASPAVSGNTVIVPFSSGELIAFDVDSGEPQWFDALSGDSRFTAVSGLNDVVARPVVHDGVVYAVSVSGRMIAVRASNGERLWAQSVASAHTPAVAGNTIFVTTLEGEVVALDRSSGDPRWRQSISGEERVDLAGPLLAGGRLLVGTSDGRLVMLDPADGSVVSGESVGDPVYIPPIAASGRVLVLDNGGDLTAFN